MEPRLFSIGHSNRPLEAFIDLLARNEITMLADVRHFPASRANPQFNRGALEKSLPLFGIGYTLLDNLGGRRHTPVALPSPHTFWGRHDFRSYADYALTAPFAEGLAVLRHLASNARVAFMCSEAVWWRCHRRMIADYLIAAGDPVAHIVSAAKPKLAQINPAAKVTAEGLIYLKPQEELNVGR